jgi:hypothetical protein
MSAPSTYLNRRLTVDADQWIDELPAGWPDGVGEGESILVMPRSVFCRAGRRYRVVLDLETLTATITEEKP